MGIQLVLRQRQAALRTSDGPLHLQLAEAIPEHGGNSSVTGQVIADTDFFPNIILRTESVEQGPHTVGRDFWIRQALVQVRQDQLASQKPHSRILDGNQLPKVSA